MTACANHRCRNPGALHVHIRNPNRTISPIRVCPACRDLLARDGLLAAGPIATPVPVPLEKPCVNTTRPTASSTASPRAARSAAPTTEAPPTTAGRVAEGSERDAAVTKTDSGAELGPTLAVLVRELLIAHPGISGPELCGRLPTRARSGVLGARDILLSTGQIPGVAPFGRALSLWRIVARQPGLTAGELGREVGIAATSARPLLLGLARAQLLSESTTHGLPRWRAIVPPPPEEAPVPTDYDRQFLISRAEVSAALGLMSSMNDDALLRAARSLRDQANALGGENGQMRRQIDDLRRQVAIKEEQGASARRATAAILAYRGLAQVGDPDPERVVGDFLRQIELEAETRETARREQRQREEATRAELSARIRAVEAERDQARALTASFESALERRRADLEAARKEAAALRAERDRLDAELEQYAEEADRLEQEGEKLIIENSKLKKLLGARRG